MLYLIAALLLALPAHAASPPDATKVPWQQLEFHASKLFVSGKLRLELTEIPADRARAQLLRVQGHQSIDPQTKAVSLLRVRSELMSNRGEMRLWMDPQNFHMYQRARMTTGKNTRLKIYRYLHSAVYRVRKEAESADLRFEAESWRTSSEQVIPFPAQATAGSVHDPSALLLLASSPVLRNAGDKVSATVFADKQFYRATLTVAGNREIDAKYRLQDYSGAHTVAAKLNTLKIELTAKLLGPEPEEEPFEFLGLNWPIVLYVDPNSRLPLQIEGRQSRIGEITVDMRKVTLRTE